jgi:hypothetical protein
MQSLKDIITDIRIFMYGGFATLPLTLAGTFIILGLFTANYAILFFLIGYLILTPIASKMINLGLGLIFETTAYNPFRVTTSDICKIVIPYTTLQASTGSNTSETVVSSVWYAMMSFFIGYLFTNAIELYNRETTENTIQVQSDMGSDITKKVGNRKTQAIIAMASILVFSLVIIGFRYYSGCESILGMIITSGIFIFGGNMWYKALSSVGEDRLSDLFGIANRLLPPSAIENAPIACIPIKTN